MWSWRKISALRTLSLAGLVIGGIAMSSCAVGPTEATAATPTSSVAASTPTSTTSGLASFVGQWHVHGASMTIKADGTGEQTWNAGPCGGSSTQLCVGQEDLAFTANLDGTITGKATTVSYLQGDSAPAPPGFDPGSDAPRTGDLFTLRHVKSDLLITTWLNRPDLASPGASNPYWCGSAYSGPECGA
jgi:hypothetical protein